MTHPDDRQAVIREARSWRGTPFHWEACIKSTGVDCGRFLAASFNGPGAKQIPIAELPHLSPQWFLHRSDESFLDQIRLYAVEYRLSADDGWAGPVKAVPEAADIVVAKCGRDYAHSALVIEWPRVIAAACDHVVTEWQNIYRSPQYMNRELRFFDPFMELQHV